MTSQELNNIIMSMNDINKTFGEMASYHIINMGKQQSYEYNKIMYDLFDKISDISLKIIEDNDTSDKDQREFLITTLENLPRQLGGYNLPISLDMMFRSDGHSFSKLFNVFKESNFQPFSLEITRSFVNTIIKFANTNEFKNMTVFYLCSDEITGLSRHGELVKEKDKYAYNGAHPFGGKKDKLTSMISATISSNFSIEMKKLVDQKTFDQVCEQRKSLPTFDARVFPTNQKLVGLMFLSRILSCYRNTVSELHDYFFGTKAGFGMSSSDKKKHMLDVYEFDFDKQCPPCLKYGIFIKGSKTFVPLKIPKNDDQFVEFLYSKETSEMPVNTTTFEDILNLYPEGNYIPGTIRNNKKEKYHEDMKIRTERMIQKEERSKQRIRPSKEEVIKLRIERKKQKEQMKRKKFEKLGDEKEIPI